MGWLAPAVAGLIGVLALGAAGWAVRRRRAARPRPASPAAWALGELGRIEVGRRADIVCVDVSAAHTQPVLDPVWILVNRVHGHDVGLHRGMTDGAIRAHVDGVVTACSIVANGAAFEHAVERLRDIPTLACGIHLALVEERPLSGNVPSLIGANGLFPENYAAFLTSYTLRRTRIDEVERELRAQIERVLQTGLTLTHAN